MSLSGFFNDAPAGDVRAAWNGQRLEAPFRVRATFEGTEVSKGRYEQLVRGRFLVNGVAHPHRLCGDQWLSPHEFKQDGCPAPTCTAYGDRACPNYDSPMAQDLYEPRRDTGPVFRMLDRPGIGAGPGNKVEMQLEFIGRLLNTETNEELARAEWRVYGEHVIPQRIASHDITRVDESGRLIHVELLSNADESWSGVIYVSGRDRPSQGGQVQVPHLKFQVFDGVGESLTIDPAGTGRIVETGSARNRTWALSFRLVPGQEAPARVRGMLDAEPFDVELRGS